MTLLHWIVVAVFIVIFAILTILSFKEKNVKTRLSMIFSSFLLIAVGIGFSLFALDKYTKKGKLVSISQQRDYRTESVKIKGKIKNIGKFKIGYCKIEVTISNTVQKHKRHNNYFKSSKSLDGLLGSKKIKGNIIIQDFVAVSNLVKNNTQNFTYSIKYPPHFKKPKYKYKLYCH
jgi:hypothetical protein